MTRRKPIATRKHVIQRVAFWVSKIGFQTPWRIDIAFCNGSRGKWVDENDHDAYAAAQSQPQYHRATVFFDLYHPSWSKERGELDSIIRHELGHVFVSPLAQFAQHVTGDDETLMKLLNDVEDDVVNRFAAMPTWSEEG